MKKIISIITLGTFLATGNLYAGDSIVEPESMVAAIPDTINPLPFYIGLGVLWAGTSKDCRRCDYIDGTPRPGNGFEIDDSTWGGILRLGYDYNEYIGIEARALKASLNGDFSETTHFGIFLKPQYPVSTQVNIYSLLGYGWTDITTEYCVSSEQEFEYDGFSYGVGLEYALSGFTGSGWGLWVDYQNLMRDEGPNNHNSNIVSFGVTYDF